LNEFASSIRDAGPLEGVRPLTEREMFDDLAVTKQEPIGKSSATPFGRVFQANPSMEVYNNLIFIHQVSLGLASAFRPSPSSFLEVLLHFPNTAIGASCWKAFGLNAHDFRIKIVSDGHHIIAIDCSEKLLERVSCGFHGSDYSNAKYRTKPHFSETLSTFGRRESTQICQWPLTAIYLLFA
jgi:hypothetical protein